MVTTRRDSWTAPSVLPESPRPDQGMPRGSDIGAVPAQVILRHDPEAAPTSQLRRLVNVADRICGVMTSALHYARGPTSGTLAKTGRLLRLGGTGVCGRYSATPARWA